MKLQFTSIRITDKSTCQNTLEDPGDDALQYIHRVPSLELPGIPPLY